jgi:dienelactone hydrolase
MLFVLIGLACLGIDAMAQAPRVLDDGKVPSDARLGELKTLNGHFPFQVPDNVGDWHSRAAQLKLRVQVATGLWPMPEKTPLEPVIHGKVTRPGFTVERVYFQSLPGHYVTGLLFRPDKPAETPRPGVLSPHGHGGRQQRHSEAEIKRQIAVGGEHFAGSGSMPKLARCAQLARMGCVTFIFDMLGYADSVQISHSVAHRHKDPRPEEAKSDTADGWVMYSIDADLRLQSIMGLQTWNAIRALDFLASLPDVDPERLAVTGGSGGGTQSILLGAIDDRIKVSFPNGMVSTSMQGGCYCENCNFLRVGTGNVELAALFAPKPQAMTAADDWTKEMMKDGYPELRWLYAMLGNEEDVYCRPMLHFKHNYNYVTRATMYQWMNRHLKLGLDDPVIEQDFEPLTEEETKVWNEEHPAPTELGADHERKVCKWLADQASKRLNVTFPKTNKEFDEFFEIMKGWLVLFDLGMPAPADIQFEQTGEVRYDTVVVTKGLLRNRSRKTELPLLSVRAVDAGETKRTIVWTDGAGKSAAFDQAGKPTEILQALLANGTTTVLLPDLLGQGEFNESGEPVRQQRLIADERTYSAFTFGYNRTLTAERVGDLLTVIAHANQQPDVNVHVMVTGGAAPWGVAAIAMSGTQDQVYRSLIDTQGFRFASVTSYRDANFVPGAVKYGDLPALLGSINRVRIAGEGDQLPKLTQFVNGLLTIRGEITTSDVTHPANLNWITR